MLHMLFIYLFIFFFDSRLFVWKETYSNACLLPE